MATPIQVYFWPTPNGHKVTIALEEMGLPYELIGVNIGKGDQFKPEFLAISPNNRMPAIVDPDGPDGQPISIFESGAILQYLARKTGRLGGANERERVAIDQWVFWQMAGQGPMSGQANHFRNYAREMFTDTRFTAYGANRYTNEVHRLYGVLNTQLAGRDYITGEYSIADIINWPWVIHLNVTGVTLDEFPNVKAWYDRIAERPAVKRALAAGDELRKSANAGGPMTEAQRKILFGQRAR